MKLSWLIYHFNKGIIPRPEYKNFLTATKNLAFILKEFIVVEYAPILILMPS